MIMTPAMSNMPPPYCSRTRATTALHLSLLLGVLAVMATIDAYMPAVGTRSASRSCLRHHRQGFAVAPSPLRMAEEGKSGGEEDTAVNDETEVHAGEDSSAEAVQASSAEGEGQEPEEDPEITALKEEIQDLEKKVKDKRRQAMDMSDRADEYSQSGYQRKVAEMENMRRARSVSGNASLEVPSACYSSSTVQSTGRSSRSGCFFVHFVRGSHSEPALLGERVPFHRPSS